MENKVQVVEQVIKYSDGTETVISYRSVVENEEVLLDKTVKEVIS